jgi:hypothetical protein
MAPRVPAPGELGGGSRKARRRRLTLIDETPCSQTILSYFLVGKGRQPAAAVRWDSYPPSGASSGPGRTPVIDQLVFKCLSAKNSGARRYAFSP